MFPCAFNIGMFGKPLPYLRRVACLESDGYQFIRPGVFTQPNLVVHLKYKMNRIPAESIIYGADTENRGVIAYNVTHTDKVWCAYGSLWSNFNAKQSNLYDVVTSTLDTFESKLKIEYPDQSFDFNVPATPYGVSEEIGLFKASTRVGWSSKPLIGRVYSFSILLIDKQLIYFIPVLDLSGRPAMYDEVSGQLFYNQGTGEFTWGELGE